MEIILDLPVVAFRNIPESIVSKLHQVTATATGYASVVNAPREDGYLQQQQAANNTAAQQQQPQQSPLVILDGTKLVSRVHLGAAVHKTLSNNNRLSQTKSIPANIEARLVSPRRLQSPTRLSPSRRRGGGGQPQQQEEQQQQNSKTDSNNATANNNKDNKKKPNIVSQLVFALNTSKSNAIKNFILQTPSSSTLSESDNQDAASASSQSQIVIGPNHIHPCVVVAFESEISPAEAWRWVRSSGCAPYVVSLDTLQTTCDVDAVTRIYGIDTTNELSSSLSLMNRSANSSNNVAKGSNMPASIPRKDISWLERQVVSKIAISGL